ncbi:MAG: diaminopimelate epimerase [Acidimicrobiia bacterium]|nr:diaminopimelate epimerase [Acidimicrobiia bacterium]
MTFTKMHGLGNDFVMFAADEAPALDAGVVRSLCDRRTGVGADGVIVVTPVEDDVVRMDYWNADGSVAEMCGNGMRCTARFAGARGWVGPTLSIDTLRGRLGARMLDDGRISVELGPVEVGEWVEVGGRTLRSASVGNPHAVTEVDDVANAPVGTDGAAIGTDGAFPEGANVGFMAVIDGVVDLRVWERGVGETLACGSGAAAAAAVAIAGGKATSPVVLNVPGGTFEVAFEGDVAWLTGPAETVFVGALD